MLSVSFAKSTDAKKSAVNAAFRSNAQSHPKTTKQLEEQNTSAQKFCFQCEILNDNRGRFTLCSEIVAGNF